ncbi:type I secretion C-terminal target domain-containing protein [Massilia sp. CCM 8733]|uniref:Type I secretion C-terminal target domain-containing protein n=2 Tax=Massilia mucilaginosa TaxID=2609282 RepID=A0ABX0P268_9BURK|nr:type I secretion C-terminal target domain-containing protein [Massilia mucilaginosa]
MRLAVPVADCYIFFNLNFCTFQSGTGMIDVERLQPITIPRTHMTISNAVTEQPADLASNAVLQASPVTTLAAPGDNLQGSSGDDILYGSQLNDTISGNGGSDRMWGYAGDDYITSNDPDDVSAGYDVLYGFDGNDTLLGGRGSDELNGHLGNDFADGGAGNDQLKGELGNDTLHGGAGHDTLNDYEGRDLLTGGAGVDLLYSERGGSAVLDGGDGNDALLGDGQDTFSGGAGNDRITLRTRANEALATTVADGGDGNDLFSVSFLNQGTARVSGGAGRDVYQLERASGPAGYVVTDFVAGPEGDRIDVSRLLAGIDLSLGDPFSSARGYLKLVQSGADTLLQFDADGAKGSASGFKTVLRLEGVAAEAVAASISTSQITADGIDDGETFIGDERNDGIIGSHLNDRYEGNGGGDSFYAGAGNDTVLGGDGSDGISGGEGNDQLDGGEGDDTVDGGDGSDTVLGGAGNDKLSADYAGHSLLDGGDGNDTLTAGSGYQPSKLGSVQLSGGAGDDRLEIWDGAPGVTLTASGGSGRDTFYLWTTGYADSTPTVIVNDFSVGAENDVIDLYMLSVGSGYPGNPFGADGYLRLEQRGADTVLRHDGDGAADPQNPLRDIMVLRNVNAASLTSAHFKQGYDPLIGFAGGVLTGTEGADSIQGAERAEHLIGLGGNDTLLGGAGNDLLEGGADDDLLQGGNGNDSLFGGSGNNTLAGEAGNDSIVGGFGKDVITGGAGDDILAGEYDDDTLTDVEGNNVLAGGYGNDVIVTTGAGSDTVDGGVGNDTLTGGVGDTLDGGYGENHLFADFTGGAKGTVRLLASGGDVMTFGPSLAFQDVLVSGREYGGNTYVFAPGSRAGQVTITDFHRGYRLDVIDLDALIPQVAANYVSNPFGALGYLRVEQRGNSTVFQLDDDGAAGSAASFRTILTLDGVTPAQLDARFIAGGMNPNGSEDGIHLSGTREDQDDFKGGRSNDVLDGQGGVDVLVGFQGNDTLLGGSHNDTLHGGEGDDLLQGGNDNDTLLGDAGTDSLNGGDGNDKLDGGAGADVLEGGQGTDLLQGGDGADLLDGGIGNDTLDGGEGADILRAGDGDDSLDGGAGNDELGGFEGNDVLHGGAGTDTINGGNGDDALFADQGDDVLDGGAGNDTLDGGSGSVQLNGGNGNDVLKLTGSGNSGLLGGRGADVIEIAATQQAVAGRVVASGGDDADTIVVTRGALDNTAVNASGGAGIDTYVLRGEGRLGSLTVKDFAAGAGGDRIDLTGLASPAGLLEFVQSGSATLVRFDADGGAGPQLAATLMSLQNVLATSITSDNVIGTAGAPVQLVGVADAPAAAFLLG